MIIRFGGNSGDNWIDKQFQKFAGGSGLIYFHDNDLTLLTYGTCVGYMIIVSAILANYLMGASVSFLEVIVNSLAIILFAAIAITLMCKGYSLAIAIVALLTAVVFAVDLGWILTHTKFKFSVQQK